MGGSVIAQRGLIAHIWIPAENVVVCMQFLWKRHDLLSCSWKQHKVSKYKADILQVGTAQSSSPPFCSMHTYTHT